MATVAFDFSSGFVNSGGFLLAPLEFLGRKWEAIAADDHSTGIQKIISKLEKNIFSILLLVPTAIASCPALIGAYLAATEKYTPWSRIENWTVTMDDQLKNRCRQLGIHDDNTPGERILNSLFTRNIFNQQPQTVLGPVFSLETSKVTLHSNYSSRTFLITNNQSFGMRFLTILQNCFWQKTPSDAEVMKRLPDTVLGLARTPLNREEAILRYRSHSTAHRIQIDISKDLGQMTICLLS